MSSAVRDDLPYMMTCLQNLPEADSAVPSVVTALTR